MAFSTDTELVTLGDLQSALAEHGYLVSQKARVLDVIEAVAANPRATVIPGPSLGDSLIPSLRALAGPLHRGHPWLRPSDWSFAFSSHFDFVVHAPLDDRHPTQPLFAVEFDGPSHRSSEAAERDRRKNRLCLASGLPLVRIGKADLWKRDRLSLIKWLAQLWQSYRFRMPELIAERDARLDAMDKAEREEALGVIMDPSLDVDFLFGLENPFRPSERLAAHLADTYGFSFQMLGAVTAKPVWKGAFSSRRCPASRAGSLKP